MSTMWHYVYQSESVGPVSEADLVQMIQSSQLTGDDYVWKKGFGNNWKKINDVQELRTYAMGNVESQSNFEAERFDLGENTGEMDISNEDFSVGDNTEEAFDVESAAEESFEVDENTNPTLETAAMNAAAAASSAPQASEFDWSNVDKDEKLFYLLIGSDRGQRDTQYGPYELNLIEKLFLENRINAKTLIWCKGMENWLMFGDIPIFSEMFQGANNNISDEDRRQNFRKPFVARMFFHNQSKLYEGLCRDISIGGMQVMVPGFPCQVGETISINVHPENSDYHFVAKGSIVRVLDGQMGFSFRFLNLTEDAKSAIASYIKNESGA